MCGAALLVEQVHKMLGAPARLASCHICHLNSWWLVQLMLIGDWQLMDYMIPLLIHLKTHNGQWILMMTVVVTGVVNLILVC